jgi:cellulose synthase/poly-beta-1,6-N-acetylglucosamine synthase-like glycosyltransferase
VEFLVALLGTFGLLLCGWVGLLLLADIYLIAVHLHASAQRLAQEHAWFTLPPKFPEPLPRVCVQVPVFNEAALVGAAIDAACALDWPRDRLEIMILDDSSDETSAIAASRVARGQAAGFAIHHVVRDHRTDFKAGALADGLQLTDAPYLAIFDVDYQPPSSFLRHTVAALVTFPELAFVQARLDYRNRDRNRLTRAQALELDTFIAYEQAARNWAGIPMTFNGTCGVWRRQAIAEAGGWSGRSLVEDQDLSFRAFARGWQCLNLVSIGVEGELPESFDVLARQRQRWGTGTAQAFRDLPWALLRRLEWHQAAAFVLLASFYASAPAALVTTLLITTAAWLIEPDVGRTTGAALLAVVCAIVVLKSIGSLLAARLLDRPTGLRFASDIVAMWLMEAALLPIVGKALVMGFLTRSMPFLRTPKKGV